MRKAGPRGSRGSEMGSCGCRRSGLTMGDGSRRDGTGTDATRSGLMHILYSMYQEVVGLAVPLGSRQPGQ
jgi:hypothetical protein